MARLLHIGVTALRDCRVVTNVKDVAYVFSVDPNTGVPIIPEGQPKVEKQSHALSLAKDAEVQIDIREEQIPYFQAAIDAGDIDVVGLPVKAAPAPVAKAAAK